MPRKKKVVVKTTPGGTINPKVLKVDELKKELKKRKLETKGLKAALIQRLEESLQTEKESFMLMEVEDDNEKVEESNDMPLSKTKQPDNLASSTIKAENSIDNTIKPEINASTSTEKTRKAPDATTKSQHIFQPLYGAQADGPICYVLETDSVTILLDCGWDETFDTNIIEPLRTVAPTVDLILISHGDLHHVGALPYVMKHFDFKKSPPVYMTIPVQRLGEMCLLDALFNRGWSGRDTVLVKKLNDDKNNKQLFTVEDVEFCFREKSVPLNYRQNLTITGLEKGSMTITPFSAGHTLGGAVWRISKEIESIVYAIDINHAKERHLNPTLLNTLKNPALMICGVRNPLHLNKCINIADNNGNTKKNKSNTRNNIEKNIMSTVLATLRNGGDVLFPTDSSTRLLELLLFFDQEWGKIKSKGSYRIALLHHNGFNVIDFANLLLSWMSTTVTDNFDNNRVKAFDLKYIEIVRTKQELEDLPSPKVIFATSQTMDYGYAHDIIGETKFSGNPNNTIIFTNKPSSNKTSISYKLAQHIVNGATIIAGVQSSVKIKQFTKYIREQISGQQLLDWENAKKKVEDERIALELKKEAEAQLLEFSAEEVVKNDETQGKDEFQQIDLTQFGQYAKPIHPMFNFKVKRVQFDDYGEVLDQNDINHYMQKFTTAGATNMEVDEDENNSNSNADGGSNAQKDGGGGNKGNGNEKNNDNEDEDSESDDELEDSIPTITREEAIKGGLTIKCQIKYAPLLGLANHRSCGILIRQVDPKKLILVGTRTEEEEVVNKNKNALSEIASTILSSSGFDGENDINTSVFVPSSTNNDVVKIDADSKYFETVVDDDLLRQMKVSTLGSYEIGILDAIYADTETNRLEKQNAFALATTTPTTTATDISLNMDQLTLSKAPQKNTIGKGGIGINELVNKTATIVGVGDLRLLDMKNDIVEKLGLQTEIREGGVLVTEMGISITKHGANNFSIEGPLCDKYYEVRKVMYNHFVFV